MSTSLIDPVTPDASSHSISAEEVLSHWGSDAQIGLTDGEVRQRQAEYGPNALQETPATPLWRQFLAQLQEVVVGLLLMAAVIAALLSEWIDTSAILAIVVPECPRSSARDSWH